MNKERIAFLINGAIERTASADELRELTDLLRQDESGELTGFIESVISENKTSGPVLSKSEIDEMVDGVLKTDRGTTVKKMFNLKRFAVAASIILAVVIGSYFIFFNKNSIQPPIATKPTDVEAPKTARAMITLADGRIIYLDSAANGSLATQSNIVVTKTADGKIVYAGTALPPLEGAGREVFNTLSNPRGSKVIDMTLSDGSHVWLNAGSSITYPVAFISNERNVSITGEAYFDIAPRVIASEAKQTGAKQPFTVTANGVLIEDLGTEFNVNAYEETKTTLVKGVVKIGAVILKPGDQASGEKLVATGVDIDEVIAWKNGLFLLDNTDLPTLMKQVERWYDIEVVYSADIAKKKFGGGLSRNLPLSKLIELLETNGVKAELQNRKLILK